MSDAPVLPALIQKVVCTNATHRIGWISNQKFRCVISRIQVVWCWAVKRRDLNIPPSNLRQAWTNREEKQITGIFTAHLTLLSPNRYWGCSTDSQIWFHLGSDGAGSEIMLGRHNTAEHVLWNSDESSAVHVQPNPVRWAVIQSVFSVILVLWIRLRSSSVRLRWDVSVYASNVYDSHRQSCYVITTAVTSLGMKTDSKWMIHMMRHL